jgi:hypothetical protein
VEGVDAVEVYGVDEEILSRETLPEVIGARRLRNRVDVLFRKQSRDRQFGFGDAVLVCDLGEQCDIEHLATR